MRRWVFIGMTLIILLSSTGCRWGGNSPRQAPQRRQNQKRNEKSELPREFTAMETQALAIYRLGDNQWARANELLVQLNNDWSDLKHKLSREKIKRDEFRGVEMHLIGIEEAVKNRNLFKQKEHSNELINTLQSFKRKYKNPIPKELVQLETGLRELTLHIDAGNWTIAEGLVKQAPQQWQRLKPQVEEVGAEAVGENLEGSYEELEAAIKEEDAAKARQMIAAIQSDLTDLRRAFVEFSGG